ncbi:MAG: hypothetical protein ACKOC5_19135 [Chloroflexota bacterium]
MRLLYLLPAGLAQAQPTLRSPVGLPEVEGVNRDIPPCSVPQQQDYNRSMLNHKRFSNLSRRPAALAAYLSVALLAPLLSGCAAPAAAPTPAATAAVESAPTAGVPATFGDPFAYCQAVGTIDRPDERYTGEKISDMLVKGYLQAAGIPENPEYSEQYKQMTTWRCMDGKVMVCNFGANLPCDSKANTSKEPTQAMNEFCTANPEVDFIPMAVTGHDVIYSWRCAKGAPLLLEQIAQVDAAGFLQNIWYAVTPQP